MAKPCSMMAEVPLSLIFLAGAGPLAALLAGIAIGSLLPSLQRRALAVPNHRSSHRVVTPQGAGLGWVASTVIVSLGFLIWSGHFEREWLFLLGALVGLSFLGFVDDINPLGWRTKLMLQGLLAGMALLALPRIEGAPGFQTMVLAVTWLGFIALINITNFVDGIDEMTVAHGLPALGAAVLLAGLGLLSLTQGITVAAGMGALVGFWWWNRHPARIFFGDAGSLPFGLLLGWSAALTSLAGYPAAALLGIAYPVTDAGITLLRRWKAGAKLTQPHRDHAFQRAVDRGLPVRRVSGIVLLASMITGTLAILSAVQTKPLISVVCLVIGGIVVLIPILVWLRMPPVDRKAKA